MRIVGMYSLKFLSLFIIYLAAAHVSGSTDFTQVIPSEELDWQPCYEGFSCAKLKAPLDYESPNLGQAIIPLIKLSAQANSTNGPYRGMLLFSPGGFGLSGVNFTRDSGSLVQSITGSNWDIVGYDSRGVGLSVPAADCATQEWNVDKATRSVPNLPDRFYHDRISEAKDIGEACKATIGGPLDAGIHMSTATVARDLLHIVDAYSNTSTGKLSPDDGKLLNFFGLSYGTYLGQTFASMFPDRVGSMVLDSVTDPVSIQTSFATNTINHLDGIISAFFIYCHAAGPEECVYYTGTSAMDIWVRFEKSFRQLSTEKHLRYEENASSLVREEALFALKIALINLVYFPVSSFPQLADIFLSLEHALSSHDLESWTEETRASVPDSAGAASNSVHTLAMLCPEQSNRWYGKPLESFRPLIEANKEQSIVGDLWISVSALGCSGWALNSTSIYEGPFGGETRNPIFFTSNSYDPVLPKENSLLAVSRFTNSQALITDGLGHSVLAPSNNCTVAKIQQYLQDGAIPSQVTSCPLEGGPFGVNLNGTLEENINAAGLSNLVALLGDGS